MALARCQLPAYRPIESPSYAKHSRSCRCGTRGCRASAACYQPLPVLQHLALSEQAAYLLCHEASTSQPSTALKPSLCPFCAATPRVYMMRRFQGTPQPGGGFTFQIKPSGNYSFGIKTINGGFGRWAVRRGPMACHPGPCWASASWT